MNIEFDKYGAVHIPKVVSLQLCYFFTHVLLRKADIDPIQDHQVPSAMTIMSHELMFETLQEILWPVVQQNVGEQVIPTYAYSRLYHNGDTLAVHRDRSACEISATIQLGRSHHYSWPIFMGGRRFDMGEGDIVIYKGCDIDHWRERCDGPPQYYSGQVFIHFVKKNGLFASEAGDPSSDRPYSYKIDRADNMYIK